MTSSNRYTTAQLYEMKKMGIARDPTPDFAEPSFSDHAAK